MKTKADTRQAEKRQGRLKVSVLAVIFLSLMALVLAACSSTGKSPVDTTSGPSPVAVGQPAIISLVEPADYELVFVCTPVWSWHLSPPVRSWLRQAKGSLERVSFITVSGDTDPDKIVKNMADEAGLQPDSYAGFAEADFHPNNYALYAAKLELLLAPLR